MRNPLYLRLAKSNILRHRRIYIPYLLTCIFSVSMFYIILSMAHNSGISHLRRAATLQVFLSFGSYIFAVFIVIFLFYTNRFLTKQRLREFGLYQILGMERRHVARVIFYESLLCFVFSLITGLAFGILFDKLAYLFAGYLINCQFSLQFYISLHAVIVSAVFFGVLFILLNASAITALYRQQTVALLHSNEIGERQPKSRILLSLLGLALTATGYWISVTISDPIKAIMLFFVAVLLVIIGTYFLFTAFSITALKVLRKKRRFFYKRNHFIPVSSMIHRMSQNAISLANICILSTMVLVTISTTASVQYSKQEIMQSAAPHDIVINSYLKDGKLDDTKSFQAIIDLSHKELKDVKTTRYRSVSLPVDIKNEVLVPAGNSDSKLPDAFCVVLPLEDYMTVTGEQQTLDDNQALFYRSSEFPISDHISIANRTFSIQGSAKAAAKLALMPEIGIGTAVLVVKDASTMFAIVNDVDKMTGCFRCPVDSLGIDTASTSEQISQFINHVENQTPIQYSKHQTTNRFEVQESLDTLYGSFFFLGIFFGLIFTVCTALIIYYKQINEGYEDAKRFDILQRVGMNRREVRSMIRSQVLTVFFLPLLLAGVHMAFAHPIVRKLLLVMGFTNNTLFITVSIGSFLCFAVIYSLIYLRTARAYYRIVRR